MRAALLLVVFVGVAHADPPAPNANDLPQFSIAGARAWYASAEYAEALQLRHMALNRRLSFVDGVPTQ